MLFTNKSLVAGLFAAAVACQGRAEAPAAPLLQPGVRLAIVGDSITEQKLYSNFIETYLRVCAPELGAEVIQLGWGGERAPGFAGRMANDLLPWKPTLVTLCYGMNDGSYRPYLPEIGATYSNAMEQIVANLLKNGARVVVGSPGVVDSEFWKREDPAADQYYNASLATLGMIGRAIAASHGQTFADVHGAMQSSMTAAKAALGETFPVGGNDGVHPLANGHLCMAYAFLKALGCDGAIATITLDGDAAQASSGHRVVRCAGGTVELESSRYPFCFSGKPGDPSGTASILPFLPFAQELNRFTLVVKKLGTPQAEVSWGTGRAVFTAEQLAQGVNLADAIRDNPFVAPFQRVQAAVAAKQATETQLIKNVLSNFRYFDQVGNITEAERQALTLLRERIWERVRLGQEAARAAMQPVTHTITVRPLAAAAP